MAADRLFTSKELYGNHYGEDRASVIQATSNSEDSWCLDLALSQIEKFDLPCVRKIILLTPTQELLAERLEQSGRPERIPGALSELEQCEEYSRTVLARDDTMVVQNKPNQSERVAELIYSWRR